MAKLSGSSLTAALVLLCCGAAGASAQPVTFSRDIAPIVYAHCASCHHPQGDGPFSLVTYDEVRRRSRQIVEATRRRYMPPWKPDADSGPFLGERRLTDDEIARFAQWAALGAPEGNAADLPPAPQFSAGWRLGEPDIVLTLPPFTLQADGADIFRNFVVAIPGTGARYVRGFQFRPGNRAVHHANIFIDRTPASRHLDDDDPAPGYEGLILHSAEFPDGYFLGWTPGQAPPLASTDLTWRIDGGNDLVVQLHMQPTGRTEIVQPTIGLYVTTQPPASTPTMIRLGRQNFDMPPGEPDYRVRDSFVLPVDAQVVAIQPHAHYRAHDVNAIAILPGGSRRSLIRIRDWDFAWQDQYRYASPFWLPAGTTLQADYSFDNSEANPRNPDRPPQRVEWGWRSSDEMGDVWIQVMTRSDADRKQLAAASHHKMAEEEAIGSEVLLARTPDQISLRNDAALIYLELGRPEDALRHFAAVTHLTPESAAAWYNEGVALEAAGHAEEAIGRYTEAVRLNPAYSAAHTNLGNLLAQQAQLDAAIAHYREALGANQANADAHCGLARVLTVTGRAHEANDEYQAALMLRPDWPSCMVAFSWLLSAHSDASIRRPADAIRLAERAVTLTAESDATALDALAAAYAAAGRFTDAVRTATAAIAAAQREGTAIPLESMRERVALYRQQKAFIISN
jgi:tetratricopeptide (TPR) repeat protein